MELLWWTLSLLLMLAGLAGTVVPFIPGTALILTGAVIHRWALGPETGAGWGTLAGLAFLMILSQIVDFLGGAAGAKYFGATRWGAIGGILGGIVGLFFGLPGLILGPLAGVLIGELLGGQGVLPATRSTWGTLLGTGAAMIARIGIAFVMVGWFLLAVLP